MQRLLLIRTCNESGQKHSFLWYKVETESILSQFCFVSSTKLLRHVELLLPLAYVEGRGGGSWPM